MRRAIATRKNKLEVMQQRLSGGRPLPAGLRRRCSSHSSSCLIRQPPTAPWERGDCDHEHRCSLTSGRCRSPGLTVTPDADAVGVASAPPAVNNPSLLLSDRKRASPSSSPAAPRPVAAPLRPRQSNTKGLPRRQAREARTVPCPPKWQRRRNGSGPDCPSVPGAVRSIPRTDLRTELEPSSNTRRP